MHSEKSLLKKKGFILCETKLDDIFSVESYACCNHGISEEHEAAALRDCLKIHR